MTHVPDFTGVELDQTNMIESWAMLLAQWQFNGVHPNVWAHIDNETRDYFREIAIAMIRKVGSDWDPERHKQFVREAYDEGGAEALADEGLELGGAYANRAPLPFDEWWEFKRAEKDRKATGG